MPAQSLFNAANTSVICRSSDGQDFLMYKVDLARCSPFFETMFTLPPSDLEPESTPQIIDFTESADVLHVLLGFCVPNSNATTSDLTLAVRVLEAARKYELDPAIQGSVLVIDAAAEHEPVRVYAIACQFGLPHVARRAARMSLRLPLAKLLCPSPAELSYISGAEFRGLISYREECRSAVVGLQRLSVPGNIPPVYTVQHNIWSCPCRKTYYSGYSRNPIWWDTYKKGVVTKLGDCTWEGVVQSKDAMNAFLSGEACTNCCKVGLTQVEDAVAHIASDVSKAVEKVQLQFDQRTGTSFPHNVTATQKSPSRPCASPLIGHVSLSAGMLLLGFVAGFYAQSVGMSIVFPES